MAEMALPKKIVVSYVVGSRLMEIWRMGAGNNIRWGKEISYKVAGLRGFGVLGIELVKCGEDGESPGTNSGSPRSLKSIEISKVRHTFTRIHTHS